MDARKWNLGRVRDAYQNANTSEATLKDTKKRSKNSQCSPTEKSTSFSENSLPSETPKTKGESRTEFERDRFGTAGPFGPKRCERCHSNQCSHALLGDHEASTRVEEFNEYRELITRKVGEKSKDHMVRLLAYFDTRRESAGKITPVLELGRLFDDAPERHGDDG